MWFLLFQSFKPFNALRRFKVQRSKFKVTLAVPVVQSLRSPKTDPVPAVRRLIMSGFILNCCASFKACGGSKFKVQEFKALFRST
jgi:hypothetical protein